jgi:hypothetical protein
VADWPILDTGATLKRRSSNRSSRSTRLVRHAVLPKWTMNSGPPPGEELVEVVAGEPPVEWACGDVIAILEGQQPLFDPEPIDCRGWDGIGQDGGHGIPA